MCGYGFGWFTWQPGYSERWVRFLREFNEGCAATFKEERMSEERAKRSMSTTFKDGLRERMADRADENGAHCVAAAIRGERPANLLYTKDAVLVAAAALAYCDQWEEVEGGWADTHSPRSGRGIILVRKAPVPTVDIEKAKREIKKLREDVILRKLCVEARIREALEALGEKEDR